MKNLKCLSLVLMISSCLLIASQNTFGQEPTKEETLKWLEKTISDKASYTAPGARDSYLKYVDTPMEFGECEISWKHISSASNISTSYSQTYKVALVEINETSINIKKGMSGAGYEVAFSTTKEKSIKTEFNGDISYIDHSSFGFSDESIANRVAKALKYLVNLSKNTCKEPF